MEFTTSRIVIPVFRGHTHAEFRLLQSSSIAANIGRWIRANLVEREYVPEGMHKDAYGRWVRRFAHWEIRRMYCRYDMKSQMLKVPAGFCDDIIHEIRENGADVDVKDLNDYPLRTFDVKMNPKFWDRPAQVEIIKKCSEAVPGMKGMSLQTGFGKTYCAVKTAVNLGYVTVIIVPGLVEQWIEDIAEYTNAKKRENIYKIEGFQTLAFLAQNPSYKPDIFVASTRTMQIFMKGKEGYDVLPWNFSGFFRTYGVGVKIIDECHKQFHATTLMDLEVNVPYNLYLSATFDQTSRDARNIFDKVLPDDIRYGGEKYDRYVTVHFYYFSGSILEKKCTRSKGYMHALYETAMLKNQNGFNSHVKNLIIPLVNQYYINKYQKGHKCLIFCSTIDFVIKLAEKLQQEYPKLKINTYTANSPRSVLDSSDLIVSTIGKSSTGLDWKGLRTCINTVSVRSSVLTSQMLGRLRKINGEQLIYVDICDTNIPAQVRHANDRRRDLVRMAAQFHIYNGFEDTSIAN